jgi:hypothetical protein
MSLGATDLCRASDVTAVLSPVKVRDAACRRGLGFTENCAARYGEPAGNAPGAPALNDAIWLHRERATILLRSPGRATVSCRHGPAAQIRPQELALYVYSLGGRGGG